MKAIMADERMNEGAELSDEQLDTVSGGYLFFNETTLVWEIIDKDGTLVKALPEGTAWSEAVDRAKAMGIFETREIDLKTLQLIRREYGTA